LKPFGRHFTEIYKELQIDSHLISSRRMSLRHDHDMISPTVEVQEGQQTWQDHVREPLLPSPSGLNQVQVGSDTDRQGVDLEYSSNNVNKNTKEEEAFNISVSHSNNFEMARTEDARYLASHDRCASMSSIATTTPSVALVSIILGIFCMSYGYAYCTSRARETYETKRDRDNDSFYESVSLMNIMGLNFMFFGVHILYSGLRHYILKVNNPSFSSPIAMNEYNVSNEDDEANDANDVAFDAVDGNSITIESSSSEYTWVTLSRITKGYGMYTLICIILWMPITFVTLAITNAGYGSVYIIVIGSFVVGALMANKLFQGDEAVRLVPVVQLVRSR
jgi:hypothetical protein